MQSSGLSVTIDRVDERREQQRQLNLSTWGVKQTTGRNLKKDKSAEQVHGTWYRTWRVKNYQPRLKLSPTCIRVSSRCGPGDTGLGLPHHGHGAIGGRRKLRDRASDAERFADHAQPVVLVLGMVVRRVHHEKHTHHDKHDECGLRVQELASAAMPAPLSHWPLGVSPALRYPGDSRQHAYIFRDRHFNAQRRQQKLSSKREAKSLELQKKLDGCVGSSKWCLRGLGLWPPRAACDSARREPPPSLAQLVQGV